MPNRETQPFGDFESFEEFFQRAEERPGYWVELAKLEFTEEVLARMKQRGISKGQLATLLGAKPAFVTRLVSGHNNFTLETMVRVARALDCEFRCQLQPSGTKACWINVLENEPQRAPSGWPSEEFRKVKTTLYPDFNHESFAASA
jgi:transcriptional regulator with XRE-family HTH domain